MADIITKRINNFVITVVVRFMKQKTWLEKAHKRSLIDDETLAFFYKILKRLVSS